MYNIFGNPARKLQIWCTKLSIVNFTPSENRLYYYGNMMIVKMKMGTSDIFSQIDSHILRVSNIYSSSHPIIDTERTYKVS